MTILSGCASTTGTPPLAVNLSGECDRILQEVPEPSEPLEGAPAVAVIAEYKQALALANSRIRKGRSCEQSQRDNYKVEP